MHVGKHFIDCWAIHNLTTESFLNKSFPYFLEKSYVQWNTVLILSFLCLAKHGCLCDPNHYLDMKCYYPLGCSLSLHSPSCISPSYKWNPMYSYTRLFLARVCFEMYPCYWINSSFFIAECQSIAWLHHCVLFL